MHGKPAKIFYGLASFVLLTAFFVLQPSNHPEVSSLQDQIQHQFVVAFKETIGDQPLFTELPVMYEGINAFYTQAADASVALVTDKQSDRDIAFIFQTTYQVFANTFSRKPVSANVAIEPSVPADKFMTEPAVDNIVPDANAVAVKAVAGEVSGAAVSSNDQPVNTSQPWVTLQDNFTGQEYCVAVYNGMVNKYLGACKFDYH